MKIGFAGSGNMAAAMARGWARVGGPETMVFTDAGSGRAQALADETGGERAASLAELSTRADLILLAVKPAKLEEAAVELEAFAGPVVSVLGATPVASLEAALPAAAVLRTMPNVGVELGHGVICHTPPGEPGRLVGAIELLSRIATLYELDEEHLDAATAVMGCSPAWIAHACEAITAAGAEAGLPPELAGELVARSAAVTGELLLHHHPAALQRAVASPGGSTEAGLDELRERGGAAAYEAAVAAALDRMAGRR